MRHQVFGRKLNRDVKERKALYKSLVISLVKYGKIETSYAKAKAIVRLVEKLVTKAKENTDASISQLSSFLIHKDIKDKLLKTVAPVMKDKQGGYTRIRKSGKRIGDGSELAVLEWSLPVKEKSPKPETKEEKKPVVSEKKVKLKKKSK